MEFRRWVETMRTRTAMILFLTSVVAGGLLVMALAAVAAGKAPAKSSAKVLKPSEAQELAWRDLGPALDEARTRQKRIVIDVYTDWCGWCRRMDRDTYSVPEVRQYLEKTFVPVRLNAESSQRVTYKGNEYTLRELANGFRVNGYPTTLFLESDGTHIISAPGYMKAPDFLSVLRYIGEGYYKTMDFDRFRASSDSVAAAGKEAKGG